MAAAAGAGLRQAVLPLDAGERREHVRAARAWTDRLGHGAVALPGRAIPRSHDGGRLPDVPDPVDVGGVATVAGAAGPAHQLIASLVDPLGNGGVVAAGVASQRIADVPAAGGLVG